MGLLFYFQVHTVPLGFNREEAVGREAAATAAAAVAAAASALSPEDKTATGGEEEILAAAEAEGEAMGGAEQGPKGQGDDNFEEETRGRHPPGEVRAASLRLGAAPNASSGGERDRGPDFEGASDGAETRSGATGCPAGDGSEGGKRMEAESGSSGRGVYRLVFTMVRFVYC